MTKPKELQLVKVEWWDSRQPTQCWSFLEDIEPSDACKCVSVGYLVHNGKKAIQIASNIADIDRPESVQVSGVITIPSCCIENTTYLK